MAGPNIPLIEHLTAKISGHPWIDFSDIPPEWLSPIVEKSPLSMVLTALSIPSEEKEIIALLLKSKQDASMVRLDLAKQLVSKISDQSPTPTKKWMRPIAKKLPSPLRLVEKTLGMSLHSLLRTKKVSKLDFYRAVSRKLQNLVTSSVDPTEPPRLSATQINELASNTAQELGYSLSEPDRQLIDWLREKGIIVKSEFGGRRGPSVFYVPRRLGRALKETGKWRRLIAGYERDKPGLTLTQDDIELRLPIRPIKTLDLTPSATAVEETLQQLEAVQQLEPELPIESKARHQLLEEAKEIAELWINTVLQQSTPPQDIETLPEFIQGLMSSTSDFRSLSHIVKGLLMRHKRPNFNPIYNPYYVQKEDREWYRRYLAEQPSNLELWAESNEYPIERVKYVLKKFRIFHEKPELPIEIKEPSQPMLPPILAAEDPSAPWKSLSGWKQRPIPEHLSPSEIAAFIKNEQWRTSRKPILVVFAEERNLRPYLPTSEEPERSINRYVELIVFNPRSSTASIHKVLRDRRPDLYTYFRFIPHAGRGATLGSDQIRALMKSYEAKHGFKPIPFVGGQKIGGLTLAAAEAAKMGVTWLQEAIHRADLWKEYKTKRRNPLRRWNSLLLRTPRFPRRRFSRRRLLS